MQKFYNLKILFVFSLVIVIGLGISLVVSKITFENNFNEADAALFDIGPPVIGDNFYGFAWNSNIGWISFNSTDCDADCAGPICTSDGATAGCPLIGTDYADYGVIADPASGNISGYAWSSNVGWISFNRKVCEDGDNKGKPCENSGGDCPGGNFQCVEDAGDPPQAPNQGGNGFIANMSLISGDITGWAKILSLGDNGWIKLDDDDDSDLYDFGLTVPDAVSDEIRGFAYNEGSLGEGIGYISFNCADYQTCQGGSDDGLACDGSNCAGGSCENTCDNYSDYRVIAEANRAPIITMMYAPNYNLPDYCDGSRSVREVDLRWDYYDPDGNPQAGYRIIFGPQSSQIAAQNINTGKCDSTNIGVGDCVAASESVTSYPVYDSSYTRAGNPQGFLDWADHYYWWLEVWDSEGAKSIQYIAASSFLPDRADFDVPTGEHPDPDDFTWFPKDPSAGEEIHFISSDKAIYYPSEDTSAPCNKNTCSWSWDFIAPTTGNFIPLGNNNASSTVATFNSSGAGDFELTVTNLENYHCSSSTSLFLKKRLPSWIETK